MLRGINQQQIFEDSKDYDKFLHTLKECKEICEYKLYAYCLMGNHIHLLMREGQEPLEQVFKRICGRFVYWYNIKYQRVGHLFQDRFKSEPVETEQYFITVLRYIHQNPTKAGLCKQVDEYAYSSYSEYIGKGELVDRDYVLQQVTLDEFIGLNNENVDVSCLDVPDKVIRRVTDEQARALIEKVAKCDNASDFQSLDLIARNKCLQKLREEGVSIRQLSRLTGVSYSVVRKY